MSPEILSELASSGTLRAAINMANSLLVTGSTSTGEPDGVAPDMAREIADRLGVEVTFVKFAAPGELADAVQQVFDFRPGEIIKRLGLRNAIYTPTAAYGHFGRTPETMVPEAGGEEPVCFFPWELTDRADDLKSAVGG